jgi:hypothetical protein
MFEEKDLKMEGENLAKIAVDSKMGAKQLHTLYRLVKIKPLAFKTKPLVFVEAYVQRQMSRALNGKIQGYDGFAKTLELLKKYQDKRPELERILEYAVLLYDYCEKEPVIKLRSVVNPVVKRVMERHGCFFEGMDLSLKANTLTVTVRARRFHENPRILASEIENSLKAREEFSSLNVRVWIKST